MSLWLATRGRQVSPWPKLLRGKDGFPLFLNHCDVHRLYDVSTGELIGWQAALIGQQPPQAQRYAVSKI